MDFELSSEPAPYILGIIGAVIALFTASGGFASKGFETPGGIFMKIAVTVLGFVIGYFWGIWKHGN